MARQAAQDELDVDRGKRLVRARELAGLLQGDIAEIMSVTRGTLRRWERGYWLSSGSLAKLAELYGTTAEALMFSEPPHAPAPTSPPAVEWPLWARTRWAELQLELVRDGNDDATLTLLRDFVLSPHLLSQSLTDAQLRRDVEAGIVAARAWIDARRRPIDGAPQ